MGTGMAIFFDFAVTVPGSPSIRGAQWIFGFSNPLGGTHPCDI